MQLPRGRVLVWCWYCCGVIVDDLRSLKTSLNMARHFARRDRAVDAHRGLLRMPKWTPTGFYKDTVPAAAADVIFGQ